MNEQPTSFRIEWRAEFETGNAAIDHEHKEMVDQINKLFAAVDSDAEIETVVDQLGEIHAWISVHFALEEKIMRDHQYDQYEPHKEDHETLLDDLRDFMDAIEANEYAGSERKIQQKMSAWFVDHFKTHDAWLHSALG